MLQKTTDKVVFIIFFFCCFTEAILFILDYLDYPTVQRVDTKVRNSFDIPAVTFCDSNISMIEDFKTFTIC